MKLRDYLSAVLFNLKSRFYSPLTKSERDLIVDTKLFNALSDQQFTEMLSNIKIRKYVDKKIIIKEGKLGTSLYIIKEGSVRVYTYDHNNILIPLARLNKGGYFGEQALLGPAAKSRTANIESIGNSQLIQIPEKYISLALKRDQSLQKKLLRLGFENALNLLSSAKNTNPVVHQLIKDIENPEFKNISKDEVIFNVGDPSDNVYIIIKGLVEIRIFNKDYTQYNRSIISIGQIFGELGVVKNENRSATAIALSDCKLISINGKEFTAYLSKNNQLQKLIESLEKIYQIPKAGTVEQRFGYVQNVGPTINNTYQLTVGRTVICSQFVDSELFKMVTVGESPHSKHKYQNTHQYLEIELNANNKLVAINAFGYFEILPELCSFLLSYREVNPSHLMQFEKTGEMILPKVDDNVSEIICACMSVGRLQIQALIDQGCTYEEIKSKTGAATSCGACAYKIKSMLGEELWLPATLQKTIDHSDTIKSYLIRVSNGNFTAYKPGQYVILQLYINENWIERPYTISEYTNNQQIRITIKHYTKGLLSTYLKEMDSNEIKINVTQPQGDFTLNLKTPFDILCIAGGIGITPIRAFANERWSSKKRIHVLYFASTKNDFVFMEEFNRLKNVNLNLSIDYIATNTEGRITQAQLYIHISSLKTPDIYLCGPEKFVLDIQQLLKELNIDPEKILVEKFVHAGR